MDTIAMGYFMEIAAGETFWEVSERNHISQSSVSKAILKLENELGVDLFNRERRTVTLTPAGRQFYDSLTRLAPEFQRTIDGLAKFSSQKVITYYITPTDILDLNFQLRSPEINRRYPDISLSLYSKKPMTPEAVFADLQDGKLDFAIMHKMLATEEYCDYTLLCQDPLLVLMPKNHRLAGNPFVTFSDLENEKILIKSVHMMSVFQDIYNDLDIPHPPKAFRLESGDELLRAQVFQRVMYGEGITFYFESDIDIFKLDNAYVCPLRGCPEFPIVLVQKKGRKLSVYHEAFRQYLCSLVTDRIKLSSHSFSE